MLKARHRYIATTIHDGGRKAAGFGDEYRDCAVRALAAFAGMPYARAHAEFKAAGRRSRCGTPMAVVFNVFDRYGPSTALPKGGRVTVRNFLSSHTGKVAIAINGHIFVAKDGVPWDTMPVKSGAIVKHFWLAQEKPETPGVNP